jgi:hypothetical protein
MFVNRQKFRRNGRKMFLRMLVNGDTDCESPKRFLLLNFFEKEAKL